MSVEEKLNRAGPKRLLALDGGGIRGLIAIEFLERIEALWRERDRRESVEKYDYDVFISYAHEDGAWVYEHVYVPFRDATLPTGKKLAVFFDTSSIRSGTGWQTMLSLAIDGSRFIVPVYTETYFKQPYCRFEILRAHRKWVLAGAESRCVCCR